MRIVPAASNSGEISPFQNVIAMVSTYAVQRNRRAERRWGCVGVPGNSVYFVPDSLKR